MGLLAASVSIYFLLAPAAFAGSRPGELDQSFGKGGLVRTNFDPPVGSDDRANGIVRTARGKLITVGYSRPPGEDRDFALAAYEPYGGPDEADFGEAGQRETDFDGGDDEAQAVALTPNGKILVAGSAETTETSGNTAFALARYRANGKLDRSFGQNGRVTTRFKANDDDDVARDLLVARNGSITLAGSVEPEVGDVRFALVRYLENGQPDRSFGNRGKVTTAFPSSQNDQGNAIVGGGRGRVVVGGSSLIGGNLDFALARYRRNGSLDPGFGAAGRVTSHLTDGPDGINDLARASGEIVAGGDSSGAMGFSRYSGAGAPVNPFPVRHSFTAGEQAINAIAIQNDGRIFGAGLLNTDFAVVRIEADGDLDTDWGQGGIETTDFSGDPAAASSMTLVPSGDSFRPLLAGSVNDDFFGQGDNFALARYHGGG